MEPALTAGLELSRAHCGGDAFPLGGAVSFACISALAHPSPGSFLIVKAPECHLYSGTHMSGELDSFSPKKGCGPEIQPLQIPPLLNPPVPES